MHIRKMTQRRVSTEFHMERPGRRLPFTLCGAAITDRDWDLRSARAKKNRAAVHAQACADCRQIAGIRGAA